MCVLECVCVCVCVLVECVCACCLLPVTALHPHPPTRTHMHPCAQQPMHPCTHICAMHTLRTPVHPAHTLMHPAHPHPHSCTHARTFMHPAKYAHQCTYPFMHLPGSPTCMPPCTRWTGTWFTHLCAPTYQVAWHLVHPLVCPRVPGGLVPGSARWCGLAVCGPHELPPPRDAVRHAVGTLHRQPLPLCSAQHGGLQGTLGA